MKYLGTFPSAKWGTITVQQTTYEKADGPIAILLYLESGEPLAKLSTHMYTPECSASSWDLPKNCFYAKAWAENEVLAREALASGLFHIRHDLPPASSGYVTADAWEVVNG